jgi:hypothetical protein
MQNEANAPTLKQNMELTLTNPFLKEADKKQRKLKLKPFPGKIPIFSYLSLALI